MNKILIIYLLGTIKTETDKKYGTCIIGSHDRRIPILKYRVSESSKNQET